MTTRIQGIMKPGFVFEYEPQADGSLTQLSETEQKNVYLHFVSRNVQSHMMVKFDGHVWETGVSLNIFERVDV